MFIEGFASFIQTCFISYMQIGESIEVETKSWELFVWINLIAVKLLEEWENTH